ncbi:hypothetical protein I4U23_005866 [Adineta vaga]|nr:hypothetical protein I4U23_005866 [Adineta vaga]
MGGHSSKKGFTEWDLIEFSNMTDVPLTTVEQIYKEFQHITGTNNKMDKKQFRHLYKQMYISAQSRTNTAPFIKDHDLDKMSDHVFEIYDSDGSGKLTFEEFAELYLMLNHYSGKTSNGVTYREKFNYLLDQYDITPGYITREHGQQVFHRLNQYNRLSNLNTNKQISNPTTWEHHWNKLDDGTGRVSKDKLIDYVTESNEYKHHFHPTPT